MQAWVVQGMFLMALLSVVPGPHASGVWHHATSDTFDVYAAGDATRAADALELFERYHDLYQALLARPGTAGVRTTVVVFGTAATFQDYRSDTASKAFFLDTPAGGFVAVPSLSGDSDATVAHEIVHVMMGRAGLVYPGWLNEGLAEYYSTAKPGGSQTRVGLAPPYAVRTLTSGALIPLEQLVRFDDQALAQAAPRLTARVYAQSWALTHMFLHHDEYADGASRLFETVAAGTPSADAIVRVYGKTVATVESDLRKYLTRLRLPSTDVDITVPLRKAEPVPQVVKNQGEVDVLLAQILAWQPGLATKGREALDAIEARTPDYLPLVEARALLEYFSGRCEAARPYLTRAGALGSRNIAVRRALGLPGLSSAPGRGAVRVTLTPCRPFNRR